MKQSLGGGEKKSYKKSQFLVQAKAVQNFVKKDRNGLTDSNRDLAIVGGSNLSQKPKHNSVTTTSKVSTTNDLKVKKLHITADVQQSEQEVKNEMGLNTLTEKKVIVELG